jgi:hypothetical protein
MLHARRSGGLRTHHDISVDGAPLTTWTSRMWRKGGSFELDGTRFDVGGNLWGRTYGMATADGAEVATADRVGRRSWHVQVGGRTYDFRRASIWRGDQVLLDATGTEIGSVRKVGFWGREAEADLPGLALPVQVFAFVVVLTMWEDQQQAAVAT